MATRSSAEARRGMRIVAVTAMLAAIVSGPGNSRADNTGAPLITIPPAKVAPPAAPTPPADAGTPTIEPAPRALLPTHVQILQDSQGAGIAMYGALSGKGASAIGAVLAIFANSGAFDSMPSAQLMLADQNDRLAQAMFTATVQGAPVIGIAVTALTDAGGDVTVFYDAAGSFAASFPRMQQALAQSSGVGSVVLSPIHLGDGKEISIPTGWRVVAEGVGTVDLQGPEGEFMSLDRTMPVYAGDTEPGGASLRGPCCDPAQAFGTLFPQIAAAEQRAGLPQQQLTGIIASQPVALPSGGKEALILSSSRRDTEDYTGLTLAEAVAGFTDPWTFTLSSAMAPQAIFAAKLPTLLQIWKSYRGSQPVFDAGLWQALQDMSAMQQMLKLAIAARETTEYNADAGWGPLIASVAVAKDTPNPVDNALAQKLVQQLSSDTGRQWRIVPPMEFQ
jgi:hypothetical protein